MDFGRVEKSKLDHIDFELPEEPITNASALTGAQKENKTKFYFGLSKWGRREFIGKLFPKGTKEKDFAPEYMKHFNAIELNATHYKLFQVPEIQKWQNFSMGKEFLFCPKYYQGITHFGNFRDKQFLTDVFLKSLEPFNNNLGPIFIQVSDKFGPERKEELFSYLNTLPKDKQFFLEIRHPDWFGKLNGRELFSQLMKLKIGSVITDTAGRRDVVHMHLTIPKTFIRFIANDLHPTDFKRLDEWIERIKHWVGGGINEVFFFMHCLDETFAPELAQYFIKKLNEKCNAGLKEINFVR